MVLFGNYVTHNLGHILYNLARDGGVPDLVPVSVINKHGDFLCDRKHAHVPKKWFNIDTRRLAMDCRGELVEIDVSANQCKSYNYDEDDAWATAFVDKYAFLHKKTCLSAKVRKTLGKDNF